MGRTKRSHLLIFALASRSEKGCQRHIRDAQDRHTMAIERALDPYAPFRAGFLQFDHGDTHDENHDDSDMPRNCQDCHIRLCEGMLPSHDCSAFDQRLFACVNQMAMNAAPITGAMARQTSALRMTRKTRTVKVEISRSTGAGTGK